MKKLMCALAVAAALAGCNSTNQQDRALAGGAIGAGGAALISAATGGTAGEALLAGAVGGVAGAVVGAATTPSGQCVDQFGNPLPPGRYFDRNGNERICR